MEMNIALEAFGALAHETRLSVFRLLISADENGVPAGTIADRLGVRPNTLSTHLAQLERSGLVTSERDGRTIRYAADHIRIRDLITFLMQDCCGGQPEICGPIAQLADATISDPANRKMRAD